MMYRKGHSKTWERRWLFSGMLRREDWCKFTDVSEVLAASMIRVSAPTIDTTFIFTAVTASGLNTRAVAAVRFEITEQV
jgi:hypothetical protein